MAKWRDLNMKLRSVVLSNVLRLEQTSSSLIKTILRMFNEDPRTLGNKSSALSFRSKIDLLFDLEEIDKTEYNHLIKLMEIRNQFAHNPEADSFESFDKISPDINKYLKKYKAPDLSDDLPREEELLSTFIYLCKKLLGRLLVIEIEYQQGMEKEIRKHVNDVVVESIETIWKDALKRNKSKIRTVPRRLGIIRGEEYINEFYYDFMRTWSEVIQSELQKLEGDNLKLVFKQKQSVIEKYQNLIMTDKKS